MSLHDVGKLLAASAVPKSVPKDVPVRMRRGLPIAMTLGEAKAIAGTLGHPSKMPGYSYGLDARRCHRGSVMALVPGSICAGCFALNGFYATWRPALIARERRHAGLEHPLWVDAMVLMISHYCVGEHSDFRWHDSGDLQSVDHLRRIVEVCRRTPQVRHWLPTREYEMCKEFVLTGGVVPENLCIRLSALMIDAEPPRALDGQVTPPEVIVIPPELADWPTSTVHTPGAPAPLEGTKGAIVCRAIELRENQCGPCRACWSNRVACVSYPEH